MTVARCYEMENVALFAGATCTLFSVGHFWVHLWCPMMRVGLLARSSVPTRTLEGITLPFFVMVTWKCANNGMKFSIRTIYAGT